MVMMMILQWSVRSTTSECDWILLAQDVDYWWGAEKLVMNLRLPYRAWNLLTNWATISCLRITPICGCLLSPPNRKCALPLLLVLLPLANWKLQYRGVGEVFALCRSKLREELSFWSEEICSSDAKVRQQIRQEYLCVKATWLWRGSETFYLRAVNSLTYLLTPWCRVLLEKLTGLQLVKKFPAFYGTRRFITALTSVLHLSLSWARPIQSTYPPPTSWRSILILSTHLRLGLPSGLLLTYLLHGAESFLRS